jgi:hypothetical protein
MAHYAFLDKNNIVVQVIVGKNEDELLDGVEIDWEDFYSKETGLTCKRTSYNTFQNQHNNNGVPFRGNYAGIGMIYDGINDVFIAPQPYLSWNLNKSIWAWEAPITFPFDNGVPCDWNEELQAWVPIPIPNAEQWA